MKKLGFLKIKLREWNKTSFGNLRANKEGLLSELQSIDSLMEMNENRPEDLNLK